MGEQSRSDILELLFRRYQMQLPLVKDVPIVSSFARNFRSVFQSNSQYQHFKDYLSGLIVLENKSMASIAHCTLDCCDRTNLSRFFSNERWHANQLNQKRIYWALRKIESTGSLPKSHVCQLMTHFVSMQAVCLSIQPFTTIMQTDGIVKHTIP